MAESIAGIVVEDLRGDLAELPALTAQDPVRAHGVRGLKSTIGVATTAAVSSRAKGRDPRLFMLLRRHQHIELAPRAPYRLREIRQWARV